MKLYFRLAWRNLWRHRRRTLIVVLAIGLTLAMMMWYDGMMTGFEDAVYGNAIQVLGGNIQVHAEGYELRTDKNPLLPLVDDAAVVAAAKTQPQVVAAYRRIQTGGLATSREGAFAVTIVGVEPEAELPVSLVAQNVKDGRYLQSEDLDLIFIGKGLADAMDVGVGDRLTLVGQAMHNQMRQRTMTVVGIYDVGMPDIEKRTIYITLKEAQELYDMLGQSTEVAMTLQQLGQEQAVINAMAATLKGYEMGSWQTNFPELQQAINRKTSVMGVFNVIILMIAGIGILNLLLMAVFERRREIGLLGALGMKPRQITWLFLLEGALMGLVGVGAGIIIGLALNLWLGYVGFDYAQFAGLSEYMALISGRVYPTLGLEKIYARALTALIICTLAAWYPAREASRQEPAQALHSV